MSTPVDRPRARKGKSALSKLIEKHHADLRELAHQDVMHEMGTRSDLDAVAGRDPS